MKITKISYCGRRNYERFNKPPELSQLKKPEKKTVNKVIKKKDVNPDEELFGGLVEDKNFFSEVKDYE